MHVRYHPIGGENLVQHVLGDISGQIPREYLPRVVWMRILAALAAGGRALAALAAAFLGTFFGIVGIFGIKIIEFFQNAMSLTWILIKVPSNPEL